MYFSFLFPKNVELSTGVPVAVVLVLKYKLRPKPWKMPPERNTVELIDSLLNSKKELAPQLSYALNANINIYCT
jgi:hypothetical protein